MPHLSAQKPIGDEEQKNITKLEFAELQQRKFIDQLQYTGRRQIPALN